MVSLTFNSYPDFYRPLKKLPNSHQDSLKDARKNLEKKSNGLDIFLEQNNKYLKKNNKNQRWKEQLSASTASSKTTKPVKSIFEKYEQQPKQ